MTGLVPVFHAVRLREASEARAAFGFTFGFNALDTGVVDRDKPGHDG